MIICIVLTQRSLMICYGHFYLGVVTFACSFLFLILDRLAFLATESFWSWDYNLSFHMFLGALLNGLLAPLWFIALNPFYQTPKKENPLLINVHL
jgi:hypothetical protein